MSADKIALVSALLFSGTIAGLFLGWTVSVLPGTKRIDDHSYITTMQSINRAILNPAFLLNFLLPPAILAVAAVLGGQADMGRRSWLLAAAAVTYVLGVLGVTFAGNVPLNNRLDSFDLAAANAASTKAQRTDYEERWNRWNALRTAGAVATFALATVAAVVED